MAASVHYFGIRHHGPGSARRLLSALEELRPEVVLIEAPGDLTELAPLMVHPAMVPPVAILAYETKAPERAMFLPFATFSPEWQAARWALERGVPVEFIDLPAAVSLAEESRTEAETPDAPDTEAVNDTPPALDEEVIKATDSSLRWDPIGALARAAGYEDGESWWNDLVEVSKDDRVLFDALDEAMVALREGEVIEPREARREAHMRLAITRAAKAAQGPVAVVCGAWHVPALRTKHSATADRDLLKGLPKAPIKATWVPWTSLHLARGTGYGAGVPAPRWYGHIWTHGSDEAAQSRWVGEIAQVLRSQGHPVSTASLIEVVRLTHTLATLRGRPSAGFEEMRDASLACLLMGETVPWRQIETKLLLGGEVGSVPPDLPLSPLLEDLARQQKACRLKPEALDLDLSLDLRTEGGLARSTLLHRLSVLRVGWGRLTDAGASRGTFRERWVLAWKPEHAVELVENVTFGATIEAAAEARSISDMRQTERLGDLAGLVRGALVAQLPAAAEVGTALLDRLATHTDDCGSLLSALPALIETCRYGTARSISTSHLEDLARRMTVLAALALPYAARGLDADQAAKLYDHIAGAHAAIRLAEFADEDKDIWEGGLAQVARDGRATPMLAGLTLRLSHESGRLEAGEVISVLKRALSPGTPVPDAASFFEGFFMSAGLRLAHDKDLRAAVDAWMQSLDEDTFVASLPLFRRVFASLAKPERTLLIERVLGDQDDLSGVVDEASPVWAEHLAFISRILTGAGYR